MRASDEEPEQQTMDPLPPALRLSEARRFGLTRSRLRSAAWTAVSHGVYALAADVEPTSHPFESVRPILPADALAAHLTAAQCYDLWLPRLPSWLPVLAVRPPGLDRPERAGLYVFRSRAGLPTGYDVGGVPCVPPAVCLGELAEDLGVLDLVIAIDCALQRGLCTVDDILRSLRTRQRGLPRLRQALALVDGRSESAWETILRVLHVICGIPVQPQYKLRDAGGSVVARGDLWIRGTRRLSEYDGADHRDARQHEVDLAREKALQRLDFERYGYIAREIRQQPGQILRDAELALGWPHSQTRIKHWWPIFEGSSLSEEGWRRLLRRLHRFNRPLRGRGDRRTPSRSRELRETG